MRLLGIPEDVKYAMIVDPLNKLFNCEIALESARNSLDRLDDRIKLLDAKNSPLKLFRSEAFLADF